MSFCSVQFTLCICFATILLLTDYPLFNSWLWWLPFLHFSSLYSFDTTVQNTSSSAASVSSTLTAGNNNNKASNIWSKHSTKVISSALCFIEALYHAHKLHTDAVLFKDTWDALHGLLRVTSTKSADLTRRVERLIGIVDASKQEKSPFTALQNRKSLISLKPPLPNSGEGESFTFNGVTMRKMSGNDDTNNNNNTLHSRDNSSGNNSLAANLNSNSGAGGGGPSPLAMGRKVKEYTGKRHLFVCCICYYTTFCL